MVRFVAKERLSLSSARDMIIDLAMYGNYVPTFRSPSAVVEYLMTHHKKSIDECAAESQVFKERSRYFYNWIGPTWEVENLSAFRVNPETREEEELVSGNGIFHESNSWAKFEQALIDFGKAVETANHELLLSSFGKGHASIENFLNTLPLNKKRSVHKKLEDCHKCFRPSVNWSIEKTKEPWFSFLTLKEDRNERETHNKKFASGVTTMRCAETSICSPEPFPRL